MTLALDRDLRPGAWARPAGAPGLVARLDALRARLGARLGDALGLGARLLAARVLSAGGLAVNALLLGPAAFAGAAPALALAGLASVAVFLRYEGAATGARDEAEARAALALCAVAGAAVGALALVAAALAALAGLAPAPLALAAALAVGARAALRWGVLAAARRGDVARLGRATLVQAGAQPLALLGLLLVGAGREGSPLDGALALVLADLLGHLAAAAAALRGEDAPRATRAAMARAAREWWALPALALPSGLLSCAFAALPGLLLPWLLAPAAAGVLLLAARVLEAPTQLVGATAAPLLLRRLRAGPPPDAGASAALALLAAAPVAALGALGAALAGGPFGGELGGELAAAVALLAPVHVALALGAPLVEAGAALRRQGGALLVHAGALALGAGALLSAGSGAGLVLLGLVGALRALALALLVHRGFARAPRPRPGAAPARR